MYVDAHQTGLSSILMQGSSMKDAKPVAFASKATTPVKFRYPKLDLEALAVDFGLKQFRYIVGGSEVPVITYHKPLFSIFSDIRKGSIRSNHIKLRHQDIKFKVIWRKRLLNPTYFLSRHATPISKLSKAKVKETAEFEKTVWFLQFPLPYTESISMSTIIKESEKDDIIRELKSSIKKGYIPK